jgi:flagellin
MGLSILNNIPSLEAQNQLAMTNTNLQNTLFQLSSGSKINSGADDPAGLSIADGLQANISALTQSAQNVTDGVGMLQTADGALSQVTTLLNRAVTLATEAANTGLTQGPGSQQAALQNEFESITKEIDQIGSNTTYNNTAVFSGNQMSVFLSDGSAADAQDPNISVNMPTLSSSSLGLASYATGTLDLTSNPTAGNTVTIGTQTYTFVAGSPTGANQVQIGTNNGNPDVQQTLQNLQAAVNGAAGAGSLYGSGTAVNQQATITSVNGGSAVVQALQAGTAGNSVNLSTSITSNVGSGGGTTLSGGKNATYDTGTLTLLANPSLATTAAGSITLNAVPDTLTAASGVFTVDASGTPTSPAVNATVTVGSQVYTFVAAGTTNATANQVSLGASYTDALTNLALAINGKLTTAAAGQTNLTGTDTAAGTATAYYDGASSYLTVTAATPGSAGNGAVHFTSSDAGAAVTTGSGNGYLAGGTDADTVTVGATTYTFVANGTAANGNQVSVGTGSTALKDTLTHLMDAINDTAGTAGAGTFGATDAAANLSAMATTISGNTLNLEALDGSGNVLLGTGGATNYGNNAVLSTVNGDGAVTVSGNTLAGGANNDTITIGSQAYTFVAAGTVATSGNSNQVALGANPQGTLNNLMAAVNATATGAAANGSYYVAATQGGKTGATVTSDTNGVLTVQSLNAGAFDEANNAMAFSANFQNGNATGTFGGLTQATMSGGTAGGNTATGMLEFNANPSNGDTLTIGGVNYTFTTGSASGATAGNAFVEIANTLQGTLANLKAAVNTNGAGSATTFSNNSTANTAATITSINGGQVLLTAAAAGVGAAANGGTGNYTTLSANSPNKNFTAGSPDGGAAAGASSGYLALNSNASNGNTVTVGNVTYTFTSGTPTTGNQVALGQTINATLTNLADAINYTGLPNSTGVGSAFSSTTATNSAVVATAPTGNQLLVTAANNGAAGNNIVLSANLSDGTGGGTVGTVNSQLSGGGASVDLNSPSDSQTALTTIAAAIATVAAQRGAIGSGINQMNAAVNVMNNTAQNLTSSLSGIQDANIGQVVANMSKYQVLEQTGIAALAQANSQEQAVLKLLG